MINGKTELEQYGIIQQQIDLSHLTENLGGRKHILLLYKTPEFGHSVQLNFINKGLLKGEPCIYTTHEDTRIIENELRNSGIDVELFKMKNLLHIYKIPNPMDHPEGLLKGAERIWNDITANFQRRFRIIARLVPEVDNEEGMLSELAIEHYLHSRFDNFQCTLICPYQSEEIESNKLERWIQALLREHHAAIIDPSFRFEK